METTPEPSLIFTQWELVPLICPETLADVPDGEDVLCWHREENSPCPTLHLMHKVNGLPFLHKGESTVYVQAVATLDEYTVDRPMWEKTHGIKDVYASIYDVPEFRVLCASGTKDASRGRLLAFRVGDKWLQRWSSQPQQAWSSTSITRMLEFRWSVSPWMVMLKEVPMGWPFPAVQCGTEDDFA